MVGKEEIKEWIAAGKKNGERYLVVACDEYEYFDYPIYFKERWKMEDKVDELENGQLSNFHHVFDLSIEDYEQSRRAFIEERINRRIRG